MRYAVVVLLCLLGGAARAEPEPPVIIVTKSEITYQARQPTASQVVMSRFEPHNVDATALLGFMVLGAGVGALFTVRQANDARRMFGSRSAVEIDPTVAQRVIRRHLERGAAVIAGCIAVAALIAIAPSSVFGGYDNAATLEARLALFVAPAVIATVQLTILMRLRHALAVMSDWTKVRLTGRYLHVARNGEALAWAAVSPDELERASGIPKATARR